MNHQKKENAAPTAMGNGAKLAIEATKPLAIPTSKECLGAIYFWNYASHSVEPLRARQVEAMV
jgi:hypothetical protein